MRVPKACYQCRATKKKCFQPEYGRSCTRCLRQAVACSYTIIRQSRQPVELMCRSDTVPDPLANWSTRVLDELLELYFFYIHDRPHSLFHKTSVKQAVASYTINKALLSAVCCFACRFHRDQSIRAQEPQLFAQAKRLFNAGLEDVSIEAVQTSLLIGSLAAADCDATAEALYCGIANRMAMILRLNVASQTDSNVEQEIKQRIWWSLYMNDRWSSARLSLPRQIVDSMSQPDLPMDEHDFQHLDSSTPLSDWRPGLWTHMIALARLFGPIQDLNQNIAGDVIGDGSVKAICDSIGHELEQWEKSLPSDVTFRECILRQHVKNRTGGQFVALHLGYHHYATLLYFHSLDVVPFTDLSNPSVERCKRHAAACSDLLKAARCTPMCEAVYPAVGHMAMASSVVLLYTLLFGAEDELDQARARLSSNFETLVGLRKYWPISLGRTIERLFIFQNACLDSASMSTHKVDRWMVRFLLEHSLPLEAKASPLPTTAAFARESGMPQMSQIFIERGQLTNDALIGLLHNNKVLSFGS